MENLFKSFLVLLAFASPAWAAKKNPTVAEMFNANAPQGGVFYRAIPAEPPSLNPIGYEDLYATFILNYVAPQLLTFNPETYDWEPYYAEKWDVSKDGKQITFTLREGLVWQDGVPMTAEDVKFSFEAVFIPAYNAAPKMPYLEAFEKVEVINPRTVRFHAKRKYFGNLQAAALMIIAPKHIYGDPTKGPKIVKDVVGAGPYMLEKYEVGQRLTLKKNPNFFGFKDPKMKGLYNFDKIVFRFIKDETIRVEMLKKGDVDFIGHYDTTPEAYEKIATGPEWGTKVFKQKVETKMPKSYAFVGWNMKNPLFADRKVRVALTHLCNRELMMEKFRYGLSVPGAGPWHYKSDYAPKDAKAITFDPKKAAQLLKEAGWVDTDKNAVLDKVIDGKKTEFHFTFSYSNKNSEKYWTTYKEDLAKYGIQMDLQLLEWNAFQKLVDDRKFEAMAMAWGGGTVDFNPKQIWHSESQKPGGSNYVGYSNPKVDKLIDEAIQELDKPKRIKMYQEIFREIASDAPYIFMWNNKYEFYLHTGRIGMTKPKYDYTIGDVGWWIKQQ